GDDIRSERASLPCPKILGPIRRGHVPAGVPAEAHLRYRPSGILKEGGGGGRHPVRFIARIGAADAIGQTAQHAPARSILIETAIIASSPSRNAAPRASVVAARSYIEITRPTQQPPTTGCASRLFYFGIRDGGGAIAGDSGERLRGRRGRGSGFAGRAVLRPHSQHALARRRRGLSLGRDSPA